MSKVPRNLDGVFYRVQRGGRWCTVCFSDMTPDERRKVIYDRMDESPLGEQVGYYKRLAELMADQLYGMGEHRELVKSVCGMQQENDKLKAENAKLVELLLKSFELMHRGGLTTGAYGPCMELFEEAEDIGVIVPFMSELGIEVES